MNKGKKYITPIIGFLAVVVLLFGQGACYLSQKLMVENGIRDRVKEALSRVIDSHKYVINVDVDLEIIDEVNEQITVFEPREDKNNKVIEGNPDTIKTVNDVWKFSKNMWSQDPTWYLVETSQK